MKQNYLSEVIYQVFALIISLIVVHTVYVALVLPNAAFILEQQAAMQAADSTYVAPRSWYVILKDPEQESCIVLMFWALAIIGMKTRRVLQERALLDRELLQVSEGTSILPEDARQHARPVQALPEQERVFLLPRAVLAGLHRFGTTRSIQDAASTINEICSSESDRMESELGMIRYIAWAIPAIGFIGTVRGIGAALSQAHQAVTGDILGVTVSLGVAFNSTFVALLTSMLLLFLLQQLLSLQDRLVLDTQSYCDEHILRYLQIPDRDALA
jgi:biopolymer transport protein ExbB/TolQ